MRAAVLDIVTPVTANHLQSWEVLDNWTADPVIVTSATVCSCMGGLYQNIAAETIRRQGRRTIPDPPAVVTSPILRTCMQGLYTISCMAKVLASRARADFQKSNLAAAKVILEQPRRYGPLMCEWATLVIDRASEKTDSTDRYGIAQSFKVSS